MSRSTRREFVAGLGASTLAMTIVGSARAADQTPLVIGVPMPLTGNLSQAGRLIEWGIEYAADEANKSGGVLGHPIKLLVEDNKGEPNTAAGVAVKMATQDKVFAFVGGFGSTSDFAMLQSIKQYKPIFIHPSSSAVKIEQGFGTEPWYYHVYIWDYYRAEAAVRFIESLSPKPDSIAMTYEDGLYGTDSTKYANQYFTAAKVKVVMQEPFKSGTPDFSPILNRMRASGADVLFVTGYSGDNIQIVRQAKELGIKPKLILLVSAGEKREDFGNFGLGVALVDTWSAAERLPGLDDWVKAIGASRPGTRVLSSTAQGYAGMRTLIDAIKTAGSLDRDKILAALDSQAFWTPYGTLKYRKSEMGGLHQLVTDKEMVVIQYTAQGENVVWPQDRSTGPMTYPMNW